MKESTYNDNDIKVLKGLEAVRKRPGMYIGSTSSRGLHHLVWEIVDNSIDEALAGFSNLIKVSINKDNSITVIDNGRGIPTGIHPKTGVSTIQTVFTVLHAGGKFGGGGYKVSGGLHGVGASVVNALSSFLEVKVYQNGSIYSMNFKNGGKDIEELKVVGNYVGDRSGTEVTFKPDKEIFTEITEFDYDILKKRLQELAFLNKGLKIILTDERKDEKVQEEFLYAGGIVEYVKKLNKNKTPLNKEIVHVEGEIDDVIIEVSLQYNKSYSELVYSFVNNINTHEGGTHEDGVRQALTREIRRYAKDKKILKEKDEGLIAEDVKEGLAMIIS